ncbi:hypothetical protein QFC22_003343 [Naganishia vaughanmartiniae]|uniref:Uncharacterized protein n=1 Tax=Naganishia vaughanmartiniae TaxID=1424756 RepID=A0ACC2X6E0_9TREE|nr:hypothetical protein QFC22_003343 [Naganishia vaughanmartiniae]
MDIDDDDAFLYGDSEPVETSPAAAPGGTVDDVVKNEEVKQNLENTADLVPGEYKDGNAQPTNADDDDDDPYGASYSPTLTEDDLPAQPANGADANGSQGEEDGEMEEDDEEGEEEEEDDDDGLDIVVSAPQRSVDFRQVASRNTAVQSGGSGHAPNIVVAGFGMNAASLASKAAPMHAASTTRPAATQNASGSALPNAANSTDGTAPANPLLAEPQPVEADPPLTVSSIADDPSHSAEVRAVAAATEPPTHLTGETARILPPSDLPAPHAPGSQPVPPNPYAFTLEPPMTRDAESVYEYDMKVMNASGQPWRARGSDLSRWFNYGFDEFTWKRYCDYRREAINGLEAMKQIPLGQPLSAEAATLLHVPVPAMPQMANQAMQGLPGGLPGDLPNHSNPGQMNQDQQANNEQGEAAVDQQQPSNDAMNSMMQMGFQMNPEQMQQQMMMMQKMMGNAEGNNEASGSTANITGLPNAEYGANAANPSDTGMVPGNGTPDMSAMMGMGGMPDMQAMMNMFGMGMPGMGNMNGMQDMSGFQNMGGMGQVMGNFGNNSPVPGMMGMNMGQMGEAVPNNNEIKRGPVQQQAVPTGPGFHHMRGGFRGRGRGIAIRGRGGNSLPLGPRSQVPNAPKGPKASRPHRDSIPEPPKAGLDYGEQPEATAATPAGEKPDNVASGRAPLPSKDELTRAHSPEESEDDSRKRQASSKRESRQASPVKEQETDRSAVEPVQDAPSARDSDGGHSDTKIDDRTRSSTRTSRPTKDREDRESGSRTSGQRETRTTSGEKSRTDRVRSSRDDRSSKEEKPRTTRRSSRSRERRREGDDREKDRTSSSRHRRTRSDKEGGGSAVDEEESKKETRKSTRADTDKA